MTDMTSTRWVLLPGTLCSPGVFAPMLDALGVAKDNRVFLPVDRDDVRAFDAPLRAAVTGGEIVCGFSLGALVLAHNLDALAKARALVLLASNPFPDAPGNRANREAVRDRVRAGDARGWVEENWSAMSVDRGAALRALTVQMAEETAPLIDAQTELAASRPGAAHDLRRTTLPVVYVTGSQDLMTPAARLGPIVAAARNATLLEPEGLGHFALLEDPRTMAQAIRRGLETVLRCNKIESPAP